MPPDDDADDDDPSPPRPQVYYGSTHEAVKYFSGLDYDYVKTMNPAEFVMNAAGGITKTRGGLKRSSQELAQLYANSDLFWQFNDNIDTMASMDSRAVESEAPGNPRLFPRDMFEITKILNYRQLMKIKKYVSPPLPPSLRGAAWHGPQPLRALIDPC
jgi:hypothetical protein